MTTATDVYGLGLRGSRVWLEGSHVSELPVHDWTRERLAGDQTLLARCLGATLDIGCGPGRLAAALLTRRVLALGIDISHDAVTLARRRGAAVLQRDVFGPLPREGQWQHTLLADGNIGIGGDPVALLARCAELLGAEGTVIVEVAADPDADRRYRAQVRDDAGRHSAEFPWAELGELPLARAASAAGLGVRHSWSAAARRFSRLAVTTR